MDSYSTVNWGSIAQRGTLATVILRRSSGNPDAGWPAEA
jgi:hypothetical protein